MKPQPLPPRQTVDSPPRFAIPHSGKSEVLSFLQTLVLFIGLALLLRASVIEAFKIPSGSMIPTLKIGDHILVTKLSYGLHIPFTKGYVYEWSKPKRGDIVVFTRPDDPATSENEEDINIIKRIIGLPGDEVEVKESRVYINRQILDEPYARWVQGGPPEGDFAREIVPEGNYFLLGDNRDQSRDSRFWPYPFLPGWRIKGRAQIIYWSWDSLYRIGKPVR